MTIREFTRSLKQFVSSETSNMPSRVVFHSFESIVDVLRQDKFKDRYPVEQMLDAYKKVAERYPIAQSEKSHPLIVLEGLDGCGKTTISKKLADKYDAILLATPPSSISSIRHVFEDDKILRTAYYSFGNYMAQMEVLSALKEKPVILDRFWHSTTAYSLAQSIHDGLIERLPSQDDSIYNWPLDLTKPDIVVFLEISEEERQRRHAARNTTNTNQEQLLKSQTEFRNNIIQAYKNMKNPGVKFLSVDGPVDECVENIHKTTKHLFYDKM